MSRFLIALSAGGGNVPPTLSVARALLDRGHDVRVITDPVLEPEVHAIGAEFVSWTKAPHRFDLDPSTDLAKDWEAKSPMGGLARARDGYFCGPARGFADDVRAEIERRPVDAAAGEMLTFTTMIGAQGLGVPNAIISSTIVAREGWGSPPFGPGLAPAKGPAGRLRDRLIHAMSDRMWNKGLAAGKRRAPRPRPGAADPDARPAHRRRPAPDADDERADLPRLEPARQRPRRPARGSTTRSGPSPSRCRRATSRSCSSASARRSWTTPTRSRGSPRRSASCPCAG